jgi:hypothetical protein
MSARNECASDLPRAFVDCFPCFRPISANWHTMALSFAKQGPLGPQHLALRGATGLFWPHYLVGGRATISMLGQTTASASVCARPAS